MTMKLYIIKLDNKQDIYAAFQAKNTALMEPLIIPGRCHSP